MKTVIRIMATAGAALALAACATMETMALDPNAQVPEAGETVE